MPAARTEAVAQGQAGLDASLQKLAPLQKGALADVRQAAVSTVNADKAQVGPPLRGRPNITLLRPTAK